MQAPRLEPYQADFRLFLLTAAAALFGIAFGYAQAAKPKMALCKHQYALCISALCIPQPNDPAKAICFCKVEEGGSTCSTIQPRTEANGVRTVYSSFHLNNSSRVRKSFGALAALLGHCVSMFRGQQRPFERWARQVHESFAKLPRCYPCR
jgi:hypothetical protein